MTTLEEIVVRHESGHAAMAHTLGVHVNSVDRIGQGSRKGFVARDNCDPINEAKVIIAAWIAEGDIPAWPLDSHVITSIDEQRLAALAQRLDWDERDYGILIAQTEQLMRGATFQRAYKAISGALRRNSYIGPSAIRQLLSPAPTVERKTLAIHHRLRVLEVEDEALDAVRRHEHELQDEEAWAVLAEFGATG